MLNLNTDQKIYYTLRLAVAMCFIGHGAFGIITKPIWCNYFAVAGIGHSAAYQLMPIVGSVDILLGLSILVYPTRVVAGWLVVWGIATALMRPLSGEPIAEFIERAGNFGAPLVLLLIQGGLKMPLKDWFSRLKNDVVIDAVTMKTVIGCLRMFAFMLLAGHGWLNLIQKPGLINQYHTIGLNNAGNIALLIGAIEITAALSVLLHPNKNLLLLFIAWKIISELFYPHYEVFEWIERGGSYGILLSLWFAVKKSPSNFVLFPFKSTSGLKVS